MKHECWLITGGERKLILELLEIDSLTRYRGAKYRELKENLLKRSSQHGYYTPSHLLRSEDDRSPKEQT